MSITTVNATKQQGQEKQEQELSVLLDLKPTLDGYAGIPQEARLLFHGLRTTPGYNVEGLIQHGGRSLRSAVTSKISKRLSHAQNINRLSEVVVSLYETPYSSMFDYVRNYIEKQFSLSILIAQAYLNISLKPTLFSSVNFSDFLWRTFFSKTLKPQNKKNIANAHFRILRLPRKLLHKAGLKNKKYVSLPRYVTVETKDFDIFVAQTPFPGRVSSNTKLVVRYHDAVPILMPHTISDKAFHQASHFYALQDNVKSGAWFSCVSEATRQDLIKIFPEAEEKSIVIHNIVSDEYHLEDSPKKLIYQIIGNRLGVVDQFTCKPPRRNIKDGEVDTFQYLLMVSTIEPRKNHLLLMEAWEKLKYSSHPNLKLVIVGSLGWDQIPILNAFKPWAKRGDLFYMNNVPSAELRVLYKHAVATVCPSLAEGFDYTGVEAMLSGGIVISSDIPVHREIYDAASLYFDPYSAEDAARVMRQILAEDAQILRDELREKAVQVSARYSSEYLLPKWNSFLSRISKQ
jgi:glycosyltransferase involved in cell wall biosynthesis